MTKSAASLRLDADARRRYRTQLAQDCVSPRAYLGKLARRSMEILHEHLEEGEPRIQVDAAKVLLMASIKVMELEMQHVGDRPKEEQIRHALSDPDDDLLRALRAEREKVLALLGSGEQAASGGPVAGQQPESNSPCHDTSTQIDRRK